MHVAPRGEHLQWFEIAKVRLRRLPRQDLDAVDRRPKKADEFVAANAELRKLSLCVTAELHEMRERMEGLLERINTAAVVPFKKGRPVVATG